MVAKKWQLLEGVATAIERSLVGVPGTSVIPNVLVRERNADEMRQVDVYVSIPLAGRILNIGIEVRDKHSPLDITEVEQLNAKLSKLDVDRKRIVSASGFTKNARREAAKCGVELRTLSQIGMPDWWLPTSFQVFGRRVELLHLQLEYAQGTPDEVIERMKGILPSEFQLVTPAGSFQLIDIAKHQAVSSIGKPELQHLENEDLFSLNIMMDVPAGSVIRYPSGEAPVPPVVVASYRLHCDSRAVPITAYRMENIEAFTCLPEIEGKQITLVTELQADGSRKVSVSLGDAVPQKTRVVPQERKKKTAPKRPTQRQK